MKDGKNEMASALQLMRETDGDSDTSYKSLAAWFIGPKGENGGDFSDLVKNYIDKYSRHRKEYYKIDDPLYITDEIKDSSEYRKAKEKTERVLAELFEKLEKSVPFYNPRYQAHMLWDTVIPANVGYITAMLFNQNNVASEASPVTSEIERQVGKQLCSMLGFEEVIEKKEGIESKITPWGHITADGSIANLEAMWAARNLKFYPLALKEVLTNELKEEEAEICPQVKLPNNEKKRFISCSQWELLNLECDEILRLIDLINEKLMPKNRSLNSFIDKYLLQNKGFLYYADRYPDIRKLRIFVTSTHHYSWPKSATVLGMGAETVVGIPVDEFCRMDTKILRRELEDCAKEHIPVIMVTAVVGSTEEGAVDNVEEIISIRDTFRNGNEQDGTLLNFNLHCDGAWGGYMRTMLIGSPGAVKIKEDYVPYLALSDYAESQYESMGKADTITVDPHKAGFIPYPSGSLCYRNGRLKNMIYFDAAYIHSDGRDDEKMGVYGIEGSKPGASPAAVWAAHEAIGLDRSGYGHILSECTFSTKIYYCYWAVLAKENDNFDIQMLIPFPDQINLADERVLAGDAEIKEFIKNHIINKSNEQIADDKDAMQLLRQIGSDVLITPFVVNFKSDGIINKDIAKINHLNEKLFQKFSITREMEQEEMNKVDYILMYSDLDADKYEKPLEHIYHNWGIENKNLEKVSCLITTVMNPWPTTHNFINTIMEAFLNGINEIIADLS